MTRVLKALLLAFIFLRVTPGSIAEEANEPIPDPVLEKRLVVPSVYKVRANENLKKVARLLYGHESWWVKVKDENPELLKYTPEQLLPLGSALHYRGAQIDLSYTVQPHDWLIRIVLWKFGDRENWEQLYNAALKNNADLAVIYPGDVLTFEPDGTIRVSYRDKEKASRAGIQPIPAESELQKSYVLAPPAQVEPHLALPRSSLSVFQVGLTIVSLVLALVFFIVWALYSVPAAPVEESKGISPEECLEPKERIKAMIRLHLESSRQNKPWSQPEPSKEVTPLKKAS